MAKNAAMAEAAQMAEENMDLFRRALRQKAAKRQAPAKAHPTEPAQDDAEKAASDATKRHNG